jgi:hypothetical protein
VGAANTVVLVGGGEGTLSEAALAWTYGRVVIALRGSGGAADALAGTRLGSRPRLPVHWHGRAAAAAAAAAADVVHAAASPGNVLRLLDALLPRLHRLEAVRRRGAAAGAGSGAPVAARVSEG